jgi:hypothetical protein
MAIIIIHHLLNHLHQNGASSNKEQKYAVTGYQGGQPTLEEYCKKV